jgi:phosphoglycolate phosphatase (TIGR01487 family)
LNLTGFALDIDGTLTDNGGALNLEAAFILKWLEKLGYRIIFVTGRSAWESLALTTFLGTTKITVGENGGVVATSPNNMILLADVSYSLMAYDYLSKKINNIKQKIVFPRLTEVVLQRNFDKEKGKKILNRSGLPVNLHDSKYGYHLNYIGINKATGLKTALKHLNLKISEIVSIGDSEIDVPMFKACGYSIALGNSSTSVKEKANFFVQSKMGEGLIEAIQHVVLKFMKVKV